MTSTLIIFITARKYRSLLWNCVGIVTIYLSEVRVFPRQTHCRKIFLKLWYIGIMSIINGFLYYLLLEKKTKSLCKFNSYLEKEGVLKILFFLLMYRCNTSLLIDYCQENGDHKYIIIDVGKTFREQVLRWFTHYKVPRIDSVSL